MNPIQLARHFSIAKITMLLESNIKKRCAWCDLDLGFGRDILVLDFCQHLIAQHSDKFKQEDLDKIRKVLRKYDMDNI